MEFTRITYSAFAMISGGRWQVAACLGTADGDGYEVAAADGASLRRLNTASLQTDVPFCQRDLSHVSQTRTEVWSIFGEHQLRGPSV